MKRTKPASSSAGSPHLLRLSLPVMRPGEPFEGAGILAELPSAPGGLLFTAYRSLMAWALAPAAERAELFAPAAAAEMRGALRCTPADAELRDALDGVCDLVDHPVEARPRRVSELSLRIAGWAEEFGAPETAFRFVQAAGLCAPADAILAHRAARMARQRGMWALAELWFRHSISLSRRSRDWEAHATAYLGLGNTYYRHGRFSAAQREHRKALRVSSRHGLRALRGAALHNLFLVAVEVGEPERAESHAEAAFEAYGPRHSTVPALAHDIAYFWSRQGLFRRSLPVFRALLPHFTEPQDRLRVQASLARAAGAEGRREAFDEAWSDVWSLVPGLTGTPVVTTSLMQVAHGAASLGDWRRAERAAGAALAAATARDESDVAAEAERVLALSAERTPVEPSGAPAAAPDAVEVDPFVDALVTSLQDSASR